MKNWFDEQIKQRKLNDEEVLSATFAEIASSVLGAKMSAALYDDRRRTKDEIDRILKFYRVQLPEIPDTLENIDDQLEFALRPHGIMRRVVTLPSGWYKDAVGAMLGMRKDNGHIVALLPGRVGGYTFFDETTGKSEIVGKRNEGLFEAEAMAFYKPFPLRPLGIMDLVKHIVGCVSGYDIASLLLATGALTLVGMVLPWTNRLLFGTVIQAGQIRLLFAAAVLLISANVSQLLFLAVKSLLSSRILTKMDVAVESATMMRLLSLPAEFFKKHGSGELASRMKQVNTLCNMLVQAFLDTGLMSIFSLVYILQIFAFAPGLAAPAMLIILLTVAHTILSALIAQSVSRKRLKASADTSNVGLALISGVQKVKLAGAEKRAFSRWGRVYAKEAKLLYDPPFYMKVSTAIRTAITLFGSIVLYVAAIRSHVSAADYYAFTSAYGMVSAAFLALSGVATTAAGIRPVIEMIEPILHAAPELSEGRQMVEHISGGVELSNVSFRYNEGMPMILDNLSLKIRPGQYVAIVGRTGCGKSTLMRLLLGFETPQKGAIYYDGKDISTVDLKSLRRKIGVVMQNGGLFQGDIFSNITISAPRATLDDAWEAAELAGIADDIRDMPMGMFTMVSEGGGGISGGQKQRLMIARAVAPKPKLLMFDEATSALDNKTQKKVSDALEGLKCTRIVIAHRLSTIKNCDRIIVLDGGKIIEDGTYDELLAKDGYFAELVARQRVDA